MNVALNKRRTLSHRSGVYDELKLRNRIHPWIYAAPASEKYGIDFILFRVLSRYYCYLHTPFRLSAIYMFLDKQLILRCLPTTLVLWKSFTLQNDFLINIQSDKHLLVMYFIKFVLLSATVAVDVADSNIDKTKSG